MAHTTESGGAPLWARWLAVPAGAPAYPDEASARAARLVHGLALCWLAAVLLGYLAVVPVAANRPGTAILLTLLLGVVLASRALLLRGCVTAGGAVLAGGTWLLFAVTVLLSGGIRGPMHNLPLLATLTAGLALGVRAAAVLGVVTVLTGGLAALLDGPGWTLPILFPGAPAARVGILAMSMLCVVGMVAVVLRSWREALSATQARLGEAEQARQALTIKDRAIESSLNGIALAGLDGVVTYANPACVRMWGYSDVEAVVGRPIAEFWAHPERVAAALQAACANGGAMYDRTARRADGSTFEAQVAVSLIRSDQGEPLCLLGSFLDITDRVAALDAVRREHTRAEQFLETVQALVVGLDAEGRVTLANPFACALLGWDASELIGRDWFQFGVPEPEASRDVHPYFLHLLADDPAAIVHFENPVLTRDGRRRLIAWHNARVRDERGRVVGTLSTGDDITERRRMEDALHALASDLAGLAGRPLYEAVCAKLAQALGVGFAFVSEIHPDRRQIDVLGGYAEGAAPEPCQIPLAGAPCEQTLSTPVLIHATGVQAAYPACPALAQLGVDSYVGVALAGPDGQPVGSLTLLDRAPLVESAAAVSLLRVYADRVAAEVLRGRAEREHRRIERHLQETQKLESLGILAGGIAHDFNNLLTSMLGHASLALDELPPGVPGRDNLQEIEEAARRAADLCRQMLAYSGKGHFVIESIDLSTAVEGMVHLLKTVVPKKVLLNLDLAAGLPPVRGDATQVRQIVMNLVLNAAEAIGERSGVVTVCTGARDCSREYLSGTHLDEEQPEGLYVWVEVSDTGCGMDAQTQARIFDPFFSTKFTGRGLGLAAVLGIVRGHRGALKVYSEPDKGTTMRILLPAAASEAPGETAPAPAAWRGAGTVLLVDDEETVRATGRHMLERLGFDVLTANDGREALQVYAAHADEIALVLLDLTMPHLDGEETFRELRRLYPGVRVVMSSGYSESDITARFAGKGLAGFVQKPYDLATLQERLRAAGGKA